MTQAPRLVSTRVLHAVVTRHQSLDEALKQHLAKAEPASQAFVQAQCYGTLRRFEPLAATATQLLSKPLKQRDQDVYCLILAGIYELWYMHTPAHACLSETVEVTKALDKAWAKGLVNALMRRAQRERAKLQQQLEHDEVSRYCLPRWLLERTKQDWPGQWCAIAEALAQPAPMTLRVNRQRLDRQTYLERLEANGIGARPHPVADAAIELTEATDVTALPGFAEGLVSVQDAAAQLAAPLLDPRPGQRVLDACAAPGGKTTHIAECQNRLQSLWALDIDQQRVQRIRENLQRLNLQAEVHVGDAAEPDQWWDGKPFERILLDAPCSGTGVIRRHPDIKRLRRAADIEALARRQYQLLEALWPLLAADGMLLYATCSIIKTENTDCIARFVAQHSDAVHQPVAVSAGLRCDYGQQLLPGDHAMDGFYYAALYKNKT